METAPYLIFYDANCRICQRSRLMIQRLARRGSVRFIDGNDAREVFRHPQMADVDTGGQIHVLDPSGHRSGGYDALVALVPALPLPSWARALLNWPPIRAIGRRVYRWIAANRYRLGGQVSCRAGACRLKTSSSRG